MKEKIHSFLFGGLISRNEITKLNKIVFSEEEKQVVLWLGNSLSGYPLLTILRLSLNSISSILTFLILVIGVREGFSLDVIFILYVLSLFGSHVLGVHSANKINTYIRIVRSYLDNVLSLIIDDYRIALAGLTPSLPSPKRMVQDLSDGSLASSNVLYYFSNIVAAFGFLILCLVGLFVFGDFFYLNLLVIITAVLILYLVIIIFGRKFVKVEMDLQERTDKIDLSFKDTQPLLTRTNLSIVEDEHKGILLKTVGYTAAVNSITNLTHFCSALVIVFSYYFGDVQDLFIYAFVVFYVFNHTISNAMIVSFLGRRDIGRKRLTEVNLLLDTVINVSSELTPYRYLELKNSLDRNNVVEGVEHGLAFKNLHYFVGRNGDRKKVIVEDTVLRRGFVSVITGESGAGKSILARVLTLRYGEFDADYIGLDGKDFRSFDSLDLGLSRIHFSSLRNIETSYRRAISVYISSEEIDSLLLRDIKKFDLKEGVGRIANFFTEFVSYYGSASTMVKDLISRGVPNKIKGTDMVLAAIFYKALSGFEDFEKVYLEQFARYDTSVLEDSLLAAAVAEYLSFLHIKNYIPEATQFYMDAVLSEPPISQGQRRRVLYALDVLLPGDVFAIDEPFANLDTNTSIKILKDLERYSKEFNAVVIVVDQSFKRDILKNTTKLDKLLSIEEVDRDNRRIVTKGLGK